MRYGALIGVVLIQACATAPAMWTPAARPSAATCSAPGAPASTPWRLVAGQGFTFCVPASWRSSDGRTWRSGGSVVGWCTSRDLAECPRVTFEISGPVISSPSQVGAAALTQGGDVCSSDRLDESVGGLPATLQDYHCNAHHVTEASWSALALHFFGATDDASTARLQLQIYRTVRFASGLGHQSSPLPAPPPY
jgi:hypothetical protein